MKILFVLTYYRPHWTGLTQYAARLAEGLAADGHFVEVLCSRHSSDLPLRENIKGVRVYRLRYLFKFLRSVIMPGLPLALWRKIKDAEAVVVYLPFQEAFLAALMCKILGKRLFLVHNGDLVLPKEGGLFNRLVEKIYYWTTAFSINLAQAIIVQTGDYSENSPLLSRFRNKWKVILPLYEIPEISAQEVKRFVEENNLKGKILIGFSGRFVEEKGVDFLLEAIPAVIEKIPLAHFIFAGDYKIKYEKYWEKISPLIEENKKNITLLGLLKDQKKVFTFYKSLALLVQPSRTDCFPSSQVESLLVGTPSVCSDIPGARWAVKEGGMGTLFRPGDVGDLAKGIIETIKKRREFQENFTKIKEIFSYRGTLNQYEELFRKS